MAEILIKCPICFSEQHCFEDTQEKFKSYMCFNCGFMSSSYYKKGTIQRKEHLESTAQLIRELEFFDEERDIYWYPSVVNMGPKGIIFPDGDIKKWVWKYAKVVKVKEGERYQIPGEEDKFYEEKLDIENANSFGQYKFLDACTEMGITNENSFEIK
jgi:hypothetical protein